MSSGKLTEAALLEITENMTLEDLLTMRLLSIWIQQIVDRSIRERGLAPIKVIMHRNKDVLCKGNEKIGLVLAKTIREKEELEEDDYLPVPFATIEVFITGLDFNPTDARMADAVKVLGLRSARKLSKVVLKFGRAQLSPQLLEVLRLMGTKPLEALVLEWYSADATYNENLQSDLEALESLFRSLRATLKEVHIKGPFTVSKMIHWLNTEKMEDVHFEPLRGGRLAFEDPEIALNILILNLKQNPRKCSFEFVWSEHRNAANFIESFKAGEELWSLEMKSSFYRTVIHCRRSESGRECA